MGCSFYFLYIIMYARAYPDRESLYSGIRLIFNKLPLIITLKGVGKV